MDILIFSDSHGSTSAMEEAIEKHKTDKIIFLGDCVEDAEKIKRFYPEKRIMIIKGNNDMFSAYPERITDEIEGHKIMICHGHRQRVKFGLLTLKHEALKENCDIVLFGHTHLQHAEMCDGILFLNPGSSGFSGKYIILTIEKDKPAKYRLF